MENKALDEMRQEIREYYQQELEAFELKWKEEQIRKNQERLDQIKKVKEERKRQLEIQGAVIQKQMEEKRAHGEINNSFVKQHLEAKIVAARWMLGLGVVTTFLFKGQWLMWIAFVIIYFLYVNKIKADAIEADKRRKEFGKKK